MPSCTSRPKPADTSQIRRPPLIGTSRHFALTARRCLGAVESSHEVAPQSSGCRGAGVPLGPCGGEQCGQGREASRAGDRQSTLQRRARSAFLYPQGWGFDRGRPAQGRLRDYGRARCRQGGARTGRVALCSYPSGGRARCGRLLLLCRAWRGGPSRWRELPAAHRRGGVSAGPAASGGGPIERGRGGDRDRGHPQLVHRVRRMPRRRHRPLEPRRPGTGTDRQPTGSADRLRDPAGQCRRRRQRLCASAGRASGAARPRGCPGVPARGGPGAARDRQRAVSRDPGEADHGSFLRRAIHVAREPSANFAGPGPGGRRSGQGFEVAWRGRSRWGGRA